MKKINQDMIKFLYGYCRYLSRELINKNKELEKVKEQSRSETGDKQQEIVNMSVLERWKIGEFLHDNLAQKLVYAKILADAIKNELPNDSEIIVRCDEIIELIDNSAEDVRELSHDIIPMDVEKDGVSQAFEYLQKQAVRLGVNCTLELGEIINKINRRKVATNLYYIAQEAIKNAVIHGNADSVKVALFEHNKQLYLHVKDDGKGLDSSECGDEHGMGISIMKHRAKEIGGDLRVRNAGETTKYNTYITCTLPVKKL